MSLRTSVSDVGEALLGRWNRETNRVTTDGNADWWEDDETWWEEDEGEEEEGEISDEAEWGEEDNSEEYWETPAPPKFPKKTNSASKGTGKGTKGKGLKGTGSTCAAKKTTASAASSKALLKPRTKFDPKTDYYCSLRGTLFKTSSNTSVSRTFHFPEQNRELHQNDPARYKKNAISNPKEQCVQCTDKQRRFKLQAVKWRLMKDMTSGNHAMTSGNQTESEERSWHSLPMFSPKEKTDIQLRVQANCLPVIKATKHLLLDIEAKDLLRTAMIIGVTGLVLGLGVGGLIYYRTVGCKTEKEIEDIRKETGEAFPTVWNYALPLGVFKAILFSAAIVANIACMTPRKGVLKFGHIFADLQKVLEGIHAENKGKTKHGGVILVDSKSNIGKSNIGNSNIGVKKAVSTHVGWNGVEVEGLLTIGLLQVKEPKFDRFL